MNSQSNEKNMEMNRTNQGTPNIRWMLVGYDLVVYAVVAIILLVLYGGMDKLSLVGICQQVALSVLCIFTARLLGKIYGQVWRYGGIQCYIRLLFTDSIAFVAYLGLELLLPVQKITFARLLSLVSLNLLGALALRMMYRYAYKCGNQETARGKFLSILLHIFSGIEAGNEKEVQKIKVAIIGAGRVGVSLAEELLNNAEAAYIPRCFIDINREKVGRDIHGIPVWSEDEATFKRLGEFEVQEIIFAIPSMDAKKKKALYDYYKDAGYKLKVYDYPTVYAAGGKRHLREFDIEELLFRKPLVVSDERTNAYYKDKIVLITGGGGSIGSELCRQLAKMQPKKIIILDIYENGAYDVQQELKIAYGNSLDLQIEICSITHRKALERVFEKYHPQIIINAAAHKHVPLMEHNCVEAIYNNVFGTQNLVELCEEYGAERFMMVSTDKAVNPTNVMGATKRMCEMIVQSASTHEKMLDIAFKENVSMVICSANYMSEDGKSKRNIEQKKKSPKQEVISSHQMITAKLWRGSYENNLFTAPWNKVIKKELLGNQPFKEGVILEDDLLANILFIKKYKIGIINEALYNWRMRKSSITHQRFDEKRAFFLEILYLRVHVFKKYGFEEAANETARMFVEFYIEYLYKARSEDKEGCVIAYKKYLPEMMNFANKYRDDLKDVIKFNIRYRLFKASPEVYYKIFF